MLEAKLLRRRELVKKRAMKRFDGAASEDIAQDAVVSMINGHGKKQSAFQAYVDAARSSIHNTVNRKGEVTRPIFEGETRDDIEDGSSLTFDSLEGVGILEERSDMPKILKEVLKLPQQQAIAFLLEFCFGWNGAEIARGMGVSTMRASQLRAVSKTKISEMF